MNTEPNVNSKLLAQLLRERGMRQAELARRVGLSRGAVAMLVAGQRRGHRVTWRGIAAALDVPVSLFEAGLSRN